MKLTTREITVVAIFPALMAATSWLAIPIGGLGAPITLQTLFVMIAGLLLGRKLGPISISIYVLLGAIGLPIFAGLQGGFHVIAGPSGGFIIGFIVIAYLIGLLNDNMKNINFLNNEKVTVVLILVAATVVLYMIGGSWMKYVLDLNLSSTVAILSVYLPGDLIKIIVSLYAYVYIRSHVTYEWS